MPIQNISNQQFRKLHELTIKPISFDAIVRGKKRFVLRKNDRNFAVHDIICLNEIEKRTFTGRSVYCQIDSIYDNIPQYGLMDLYIILSITAIFKING